MDTINRRTTLGSVILGLILGLVIACEDEKPDPFRMQCIESATAFANCAGYDVECAEGCHDECTARGHKAEKASAECGDMWIAVHSCVADLDCEMQAKWEDAHWKGESGFPCEDLELKFRQECPELPLFPNDE